MGAPARRYTREPASAKIVGETPTKEELMAKISARGDREVARARRDNGATMVLTEQGRVLRKLLPTDGYSLMGRVKGADGERRKRFVRIAERHGYEVQP
jgi:hypothetical protein